MDTQKIGRFIAENRKKQNMTQVQLAEKLGVTGKTVSRWENGNYMPDLSLLQPLAKELGITVNELLQGESISSEQLPQKAEENIQMSVEYSDKKIKKVKILFAGLLIVIFFVIIMYNHYKEKYYLTFSTADECRNFACESVKGTQPGMDTVYYKDEIINGNWYQICMVLTDEKLGVFVIEHYDGRYRIADSSTYWYELTGFDDKDSEGLMWVHIIGYNRKDNPSEFVIAAGATAEKLKQVIFNGAQAQMFSVVNGRTLWYVVFTSFPWYHEIEFITD